VALALLQFMRLMVPLHVVSPLILLLAVLTLWLEPALLRLQEYLR